ncbi:MAG: efflux transporter periplasmic adaptor subunit, partial [Rhodoferax sp.]|nr:efflux transporter periplasmic adaptor subunit [Rhodoferax sp.]
MSLSDPCATAFTSVSKHLRGPQGWAALSLTALLVACGQSAPPAAGPGGPGGMPPPAEVGVVTVTMGDVGLLTELP